MPTSCTGYRHPGSGYIPQKNNGVYWLQLNSTSPPFKAYCDLNHDEGGWTLIARYAPSLKLANFDPTKHQIQNAQSGSSITAPPDLSDLLAYGHLRYDLYDPLHREVRITCSGTHESAPGITEQISAEHTSFRLFGNWNEGDKGNYGAEEWGFLGYNQMQRSQNGLCGSSLQSTNSTIGGIAYCKGAGSANHTLSHHVSIAFAKQDGQATAYCNGKLLKDGAIHVWIRELGRNPLVMDSTQTRLWRNGSTAPSCKEYRFSEGGQYTGATGSGAYMIHPSTAPRAFRVYCDMEFEHSGKQGGWTLFARYHQDNKFIEYHPFVHFEQVPDGLQTERAQPPDLNQRAFYGHINYQWFSPAGKELHFEIHDDSRQLQCNEARPYPHSSWVTGNSGNTALFTYLAPKNVGFDTSNREICRTTGAVSGSARAHGFGFCASNRTVLGAFKEWNMDHPRIRCRSENDLPEYKEISIYIR
jgi:hypothetical protein